MILKQYMDVGCQISDFRGRQFHLWGLNCVLSEKYNQQQFFHVYLNLDYINTNKTNKGILVRVLDAIPFKIVRVDSFYIVLLWILFLIS